MKKIIISLFTILSLSSLADAGEQRAKESCYMDDLHMIVLSEEAYIKMFIMDIDQHIRIELLKFLIETKLHIINSHKISKEEKNYQMKTIRSYEKRLMEEQNDKQHSIK